MGKLLSKIIEKKTGTPNIFLKSLDMDRSTFYKIKSGQRKPTKAQFCEIVCHLNVRGELRRKLIEEFEMERLWKQKQSKLLPIVREFLSYLNCKQNFPREEVERGDGTREKLPVPEYVKEIFKREFQNENREKIRIRICPAVLDRYDWDSLWSVLKEVDSVLEIDFLLNNSIDENYDVIRKLRHTEIYFSFVKSGKLKISVYRENFSNQDSVRVEDPYPFFVIGSKEILLIREDLKEVLRLQKDSVIRSYKESFEKRLIHSYAVIEQYDGQKTMQDMLLEQFGEASRKRMNIFTLSEQVSRLPGMPPQMIRKLFPAELSEWLCEIRQFYIESEACAFLSEREYAEALSRTEMSEWGERRELGQEELAEIRKGMENRRRERKVILIPDYYDYIPNQSTLHLFGGEEMFLLMWEHDDVLIRIRERELIDGMYQWFMNRMEIEEIEKLIGMPNEDTEEQEEL